MPRSSSATRCRSIASAIGRARHYCAPIECQTDNECGDGASYADMSLRLHNRGPERPSPALERKGPCHDASDCAPKDACLTKRFLRGASRKRGSERRAERAATAGLAALIAIVATVLRRRR